MDHQQAEELRLAVKYVLGELAPVQRDEYEDHYIDCPECAKDVHAAAAFTDTAREVFRQDARKQAPSPAREREGWFAWFRPVVAVPALLLLLAVVGYQNLMTLPRLKSEGAAGKAQVFNSFALMGPVRGERGEPEAKVQVQKNETFALDFDFVLTREAKRRGFDHYVGQLQDETGPVLLQVAIPAEKVGQEVHLLVPSGVERAGKYSVVVAGDPGAKGEWNKANEVSRWNFVVDFHP
jgi:anti-sigma factor RsiW